AYLVFRSFSLVRRRELVSLVGELYVPSSLFLFYGFFGFLIYFMDDHKRFSYAGVYFDNWSVFYGFIIISIPILVISFLFRFLWKHFRGLNLINGWSERERLIKFLLFFIIIFDVFSRIKMISDGE